MILGQRMENASARRVEFRYADPPKAGFNRASAFPVATRLERLDLSSSTGLVDRSR
jgi:hypothetical protein